MAFTAIPESNSVKISVLPFDFEKKKMINEDKIPPKNENKTTLQIECKKGMDVPRTMAIAANREQPAVIPIRPGSTIGFRKRPCAKAPDHANDPPTISPRRILGTLSSKNTRDSMLSL